MFAVHPAGFSHYPLPGGFPCQLGGKPTPSLTPEISEYLTFFPVS